MTGHEALVVLGAVAFVAWVVSLLLHPYTRCVACKGNRGRNTGSTSRVWGRCPVCKGSGERRRFGAALVHKSMRRKR